MVKMSGKGKKPDESHPMRYARYVFKC